jgi:hypothetical protein
MFGIHMIFGPQTAVVRLNNGPTYIKPHSHTIFFGTKEGLKHPRNDGFGNAGARIGNLDAEHAGEGTGFQISGDAHRGGRPA